MPALKQTDSPSVTSQLPEVGRPSQYASLDRSLIQGVAWMGGMKWLTQLVAWGSTFVVARILTPADYGLVGLATAYLGIVTLLSEFGIGTTVVALRNLEHDELAQMNTVSLLFGGASFLVSCMVAPLLARFFAQPQLTMVVIAMSTIYVITGLRVVPQAVLQRDMRFRELAINDGIQAIVLSLGAVLFAVLGFRYWTLVLSSLLGAILSTVLVMRLVRTSLRWPRWRELAHALSFSRQTIIGRLAWYFYQNADFFVAGKVLGRDLLGAYTFGWNLASAPIERITSLIARVTPSILSAAQCDNAALRRYVLTVTEALALVSFPLTVGLALVAGDLVPLALGDKWLSMIAPLQLLCIAASLRAITPILPQVLTVTGHNRLTMRINLFGLLIMPLAFAIGSRWGTVGIALGWVVVYPVAVAGPTIVLVLRRIELPLAGYLLSLVPATSSVLLMTAAVIGVRLLIPSFGTGSHLASVVRDVLVGAIVYTAALLILHRSRLAAFTSVWRRGKS